MRLRTLIAAVIGLAGIAISMPDSASADGFEKRPSGWGKTRHIHHHVYYPRYVHHYKVDPYAWRYSPRGYYPYYGSAYWVPSAYAKWRNREHLRVWNTQPPYFRYYKSWGYPRHWHHHAWHHKHHGYHHRWHW